MQTDAFEAALRWNEPVLAGLAPDTAQELRRRMRLDGSGEGFGLLEPAAGGWTLCIPDGAEAEATVGDAPVDLGDLRLEPSGERRLPLCAGLRAHVRMGAFRFEVVPSA